MMATKFQATARVGDDGSLLHGDRVELRAWLKEHAGQTVTLTIQRKAAKRSLDQNAYWWAEPVPRLAEHCGYTPSQMHYALLGECFGYTNGPMGNTVPNKPSSSDLTVAEFKQLIDWVLIWAPAELGCVVMPPDEWQKGQAA